MQTLKVFPLKSLHYGLSYFVSHKMNESYTALRYDTCAQTISRCIPGRPTWQNLKKDLQLAQGNKQLEKVSPFALAAPLIFHAHKYSFKQDFFWPCACSMS